MDPTGGYDAYDFVSEFYDHVVPYRERPDIDFYVEMALNSGGPILELGCGTGRVLIPTAKAGVNIFGLDLSSSMLETCQAKIREEPKQVQERITLEHGDLQSFNLDRSFPLITIPFRPFQHLLTVEAQLDCLHCVFSHLMPGGLFILDVFNPSLQHLVDPEGLQERSPEPEFSLPDGRIVTRKHRIVSRDYFNQINDIELIYEVHYPDGKQERLVHSFQMRYLFRFEVEHLLARVGFEVEAIYADFDRSSYGSIYPGELIILARKPAERVQQG
jgi:SAM-dependent methyltransferase